MHQSAEQYKHDVDVSSLLASGRVAAAFTVFVFFVFSSFFLRFPPLSFLASFSIDFFALSALLALGVLLAFCAFSLGLSLASTAAILSALVKTNETSFARPWPVLELRCLRGVGKRKAKLFSDSAAVEPMMARPFSAAVDVVDVVGSGSAAGHRCHRTHN